MFPSHLRMDSLFAGVLMAFYFHRNKDRFLDFARRFRLLLLVVGSLILCQAYWIPLETGTYMRTYGFTTMYVGGAALLAAFIGMENAQGRAGKTLAWIGTHSYSIYLWHVPALLVASTLGGKVGGKLGWQVFVVFYFSGSIAGGILLAKVIEIPALRIRDKYFPSRGISVTTPDISPGG